MKINDELNEKLLDFFAISSILNAYEKIENSLFKNISEKFIYFKNVTEIKQSYLKMKEELKPELSKLGINIDIDDFYILNKSIILKGSKK